MDDSNQSTVLIVDDEPATTDLYAEILMEHYTVRKAYDGEEALTKLDEYVDVVLLDRRMPDISGDKVLDEIRNQDVNCRTVMVTAVAPEIDVIDMDFDDYLVKPVSKEDLHETLERMFTRTTYHELAQEYCALVSKYATLRTHRSDNELENSTAFTQLEERIHELNDRLDEKAEELTPINTQIIFREGLKES